MILQPDQGAYDKWAEIGMTLTMCDEVLIDDIMERAREEGLSKEGDDLADLIFNYTHDVSREVKQLVGSCKLYTGVVSQSTIRQAIS